MSDDHKESFLGDQGHSDTASTVGNKLFGPSGAMSYRVTLQGGAGQHQFDVVAESGDDAAEKAHARFMGSKVTRIEPSPQNERAAA